MHKQTMMFNRCKLTFFDAQIEPDGLRCHRAVENVANALDLSPTNRQAGYA
jgi:hypothetical protein